MKRNAKAICVFVFLLTLLCLWSTLSAGTPTSLAINNQLVADHPELAKIAKMSEEATVWLRQSDTLYEWGGVAWYNRERHTYTYGSGNLLTGDLQQVWDGSAWADTINWTATYDGDGRILTSLFRIWDDTGWTNDMLMTVTYDDVNDSMIAVLQTWSSGDGDWANLTKTLYAYTDGLISTRVVQTWSTDHWVNNEQDTYTFNASDVLTTLVVKIWSGSAWVNSVQDKYFYYYNGLDSVSIGFSWSTVWDSSFQHQYAFDDMLNNVRYTYLTYDEDSTQFYEQHSDTLKWDAGYCRESVHYIVSTDSLSRVRHSIDPVDGCLTQDIAQYLDGATWTNMRRTAYYWAPALVVNVDDQGTVPSSYSISQNYPNPFNPMTVIHYSLSQRAPVRISIFNVLGQEVTTLVNETQPAGTYETNWDGLDHTGKRVGSGVYFYRISAGNFSETRKMVLLK